MPLAAGMATSNALELLKRVMFWTAGHPYLTQRLCQGVAEDATVRAASDVDRVCREVFFSPEAREQNDNLLFVRDRLLRSEVDVPSLLDLYREMRLGKAVPDDETNPLCDVLKLSGITKVGTNLSVRNRIYERAFDVNWVGSHMPDAEVRRQKRAYRQGVLRTAAFAVAVLAVMAVLAASALVSARTARSKAELAALREEQSKAFAAEAQAEKSRAQQQESRATQKSVEADQQKKIAQRKTGEAQFERLKAITTAHQLARALATESLATARANREAARSRLAEAQTRTEKDQEDHQLYDADMLLIQSEWDHDNLRNVFNLLSETRHNPYRGFDWFYWHRVVHSSVVAIPTRDTECVQFSADGKQFATGSDDGTVSLWDAKTGLRLKMLTGHTDSVNHLALSPDGKRLATAGLDERCKVWDLSTGKVLYTLDGHPHGASVAISADGKLLATSCGAENWVKIWDFSTGRPLRTLTPSTSFQVRSLAFSPESHRLVVGYQGTDLRVWDADTGANPMAVRGGQFFDLIAVAFSPDGTNVASGAGNGSLFLRNSKTGDVVKTYAGGPSGILSVQFSPDGRTLAAGSTNCCFTLWQTETGRQLNQVLAHDGWVTGVAYSQDGTRLATCSNGGGVKVWDVGRLGGRLSDMITRAIAFSRDGRQIAAIYGDDGKTTSIVDVADRRERLRLAPPEKICSAVFSPDGKQLATGQEHGSMTFWDSRTGVKAREFKPHASAVNPVAFSPDGSLIATGSADMTVELWDSRTFLKRMDLGGNSSDVLGIKFSPDGKRIASMSKDCRLIVWDVHSGRKLSSFQWETGTPSSRAVYYYWSAVEFSPDGKLLATGYSPIQLWDAATGKRVRTISGTYGAQLCLAFSPDGKRLAATGLAGTLQLWDVPTGKLLATLSAPGIGLCVAFSPDGSKLVAGSERGLRVYEASDSTQVARGDREDHKHGAAQLASVGKQ